ncbi:MAG: GDP-L-fucose synthase [Candidatus Liptonbacteria bacterium]|nr:GDP-L-fucose synthase [Candidatus Liptonbacteria bacterium]
MRELKEAAIVVTGGAGFLGTHLVERLVAHGARRERIQVVRREEYDLRELEDCAQAVAGKDVVFHLAAKVGGIGFNQQKPGELFYDNIVMATQLVEASFRAGVKKFVGLGTVCAYPKFTPVPFKEDYLWDGYPEETNAPYGLAKKALLTQLQAYRTQYGFNGVYLLPVNLYGPGDSFDPARSHVIPALIRKVYEARHGGGPVEVWGTGRATREFLYVEDAAEGIVRAAERYDSPMPVNVGSGAEISIKDLVSLICRLMEYEGEIRWDISKPDGQPRRMLDTTRAEREFAFKASVSFEEGLRRTIAWYEAEMAKR